MTRRRVPSTYIVLLIAGCVIILQSSILFLPRSSEFSTPSATTSSILRRLLRGRPSQEQHQQEQEQEQQRFLQSNECRSQSSLLKDNYFDLYEDVQTITEWISTTQGDDVICESQSKDKTTCLLNYTAAPTTLEESCISVAGGVFVTTTFVFQCTFSDGSTLFYTAQDRPECYHASSCDMDDITALEDEISVVAMDDLVEGQGNGIECRRVRLKVSDPIYPPDNPGGGEGENPSSNTTTTTSTCENQTAEYLTSLQGDQQALSSEATTAMESTCVDSDNGGTEQQLCQADFEALSHTIDEICSSSSSSSTPNNGLYLEMDYTLTCHPEAAVTGEGDETAAAAALIPRVISVLADPLCTSKNLCTISQTYQLAEEYAKRVFFVVSDDTAEATTIKPAWTNCTVSNLSIRDFAPRPVTEAPEQTISPAPTPAPTEGGCLKMSQVLNATDAIQERLLLAWESRTVSEPRVLNRKELQDGSFDYTCGEEEAAAVGSTTDPTVRRRRRRQRELQNSGDDGSSWCEVIDFTTASSSNNNETADNDNNDFRSTCNGLGGMFVEEVYRIHCESSQEGNNTVVERLFHNKPACRYATCDGVDIQQVMGSEMDWMRQGMEQELGGNMWCWFQDVKLLAGAGNVDQYPANGDIPAKLQVSDQCESETTRMATFIPIYNGNQIARRNFKEYTDKDLRQLCVSPVPRTLSCQFDWEVFAMTDAGDDGEPPVNMLQTTCHESGGQYVTYQFISTCYKADEDKTLYSYSNNYPACVGISCSPGQAELLLRDQEDWPNDKFVTEGYTCETTLSSVFTPDYIPPDERVPTEAPTRAPVVDTPSTGGTTPADPSNGDLNNEPTTTSPTTPDEEGVASPAPPSGNSNPSSLNSNAEDDDDHDDPGLISVGVLAGIAVAVLLVAAGVGYYIFYKRRGRRTMTDLTEKAEDEATGSSSGERETEMYDDDGNKSDEKGAMTYEESREDDDIEDSDGISSSDEDEESEDPSETSVSVDTFADEDE